MSDQTEPCAKTTWINNQGRPTQYKCFQELVVQAEVNRRISSTLVRNGNMAEMVCEAVSVPAGTYSFAVSRNGQDFSGSRKFQFYNDPRIGLAKVKQTPTGCEISVYGLNFQPYFSMSVIWNYTRPLDPLVWPRSQNNSTFVSSWHMRTLSQKCPSEATKEVSVILSTEYLYYTVQQVMVVRGIAINHYQTLHVGKPWRHNVANTAISDAAIVQSQVMARRVTAGSPFSVKLELLETFANTAVHHGEYYLVSSLTTTCNFNCSSVHVNREVKHAIDARFQNPYVVLHTVTIAGKYNLSIRTRLGTHVGGSPFSMTVIPAPVAVSSTSLQFQPAMVDHHWTCVATDMTTCGIIIGVEDAYGNPRQDVGNETMLHLCAHVYYRPLQYCSVCMHGLGLPSGSKYDGCGYFYKLSPEMFRLQLNITRSAIFQLELLVGSNGLPGSPFQLAVKPGPAHASKCQVVFRRQNYTEEIIGKSASAVIFAFDVYGNRRLQSNDHFFFILSRTDSSCVVSSNCNPLDSSSWADFDDSIAQDPCSSVQPAAQFRVQGCVFSTRQNVSVNNNGSYSFTYASDIPGVYNLSVWLGGTSVVPALVVSRTVTYVTNATYPNANVSVTSDETTATLTRTLFSNSTKIAHADDSASWANTRSSSGSASGSWNTDGRDFGTNYTNQIDKPNATALDQCRAGDAVHISGIAKLETSLSVVEVSLNRAVYLQPGFAMKSDCSHFIASIERAHPFSHSDKCSESISGHKFVECNGYCLPRSAVGLPYNVPYPFKEATCTAESRCGVQGKYCALIDISRNYSVTFSKTNFTGIQYGDIFLSAVNGAGVPVVRGVVPNEINASFFEGQYQVLPSTKMVVPSMAECEARCVRTGHCCSVHLADNALLSCQVGCQIATLVSTVEQCLLHCAAGNGPNATLKSCTTNFSRPYGYSPGFGSFCRSRNEQQAVTIQEAMADCSTGSYTEGSATYHAPCVGVIPVEGPGNWYTTCWTEIGPGSGGWEVLLKPELPMRNRSLNWIGQYHGRAVSAGLSPLQELVDGLNRCGRQPYDECASACNLVEPSECNTGCSQHFARYKAIADATRQINLRRKVKVTLDANGDLILQLGTGELWAKLQWKNRYYVPNETCAVNTLKDGCRGSCSTGLDAHNNSCQLSVTGKSCMTPSGDCVFSRSTCVFTPSICADSSVPQGSSWAACANQTFCSTRHLVDVRAALGNHSVCQLVTPRRFRVVIARGGMLLPGDSLRLRRCAFEVDARPVASTVRVGWVATQHTVFPVIAAPSIIGECSPLTLDSSLSSSFGPQDPQLTWSLVGSQPDEKIREILAQASSQNAATVLINFTAIGDDSRFGFYTFRLSMRNPISEETRMVLHTVERRQQNLPVVRVAGPSTRYVRRFENVLLVAEAEHPACQGAVHDSSPLQFTWTGPQKRVSTGPVLLLEAYSLQVGEVASFEVAVSTITTATSTANVTVECIAEPLVANIRGGSSRTVGKDQVFTIDGTSSVDPDDPKHENTFEFTALCTPLSDENGERLLPAYSWGCKVGDRVTIIAADGSSSRFSARIGSIAAHPHETVVINWDDNDQRNRMHDVHHVMHYGRKVPCGTLVNVAHPQCPIQPVPTSTPGVYVMDARQLLPGRTYSLSILVAKDTRSANATTTIKVATGADPPVVSIDYPIHLKYNAGQRLFLRSRQLSGDEDSTTLLWSLVDDNLLAVDTAKPGFLGTGIAGKNLVINPGSLAAGKRYVFKLDAISPGGQGFASVEIRTNSAPTGGIIQVEPAIGEAVRTKFGLRAPGWWDEDTPIRFRFGLSKNGRRSMLSDLRDSYVLGRVLLPAGAPLLVDVYVVDVYAAESTASTPITVSRFEGQLTTGELESAFENAQKTGDLESVGMLVDVFLALLSESPSRRQLGLANLSSVAASMAARLWLMQVLADLIANLPITATTISRFSHTLLTATATHFSVEGCDHALASLTALCHSGDVAEDAPLLRLLTVASQLVAVDCGRHKDRSTKLFSLVNSLSKFIAKRRLSGEHPWLARLPSLTLRIDSNAAAAFDTGVDLDGIVQLPRNCFGNDSKPLHVQYILWRHDPLVWAPQRPWTTSAADNVTVAAGFVTFEVLTGTSDDGQGAMRSFSARVPFTVMLRKLPQFVDAHETHQWHCGVWNPERSRWMLAGRLVQPAAQSVDYVRCMYNSYGTFAAFYGEILDHTTEQSTELDATSILLATALLGVVTLSVLLALVSFAVYWRSMEVLRDRKKRVLWYLESDFAVHTYPTERRQTCVATLWHRLRVDGTLCTLLCGYSGVPQLPRVQSFLVLSSDVLVITATNVLLFDTVDIGERFNVDRDDTQHLDFKLTGPEFILCAIVSVAAIPSHLLIRHFERWLAQPTEDWLEAEFQLRRQFLAAERLKSLSSKSFSNLGSKSFRSKSFSAKSSRNSNESLYSASVGTGLGVASASFGSFVIKNGVLVNGQDEEQQLAHLRHRGVRTACHAYCVVLAHAVLWAVGLGMGALTFSVPMFNSLARRCVISVVAKWIALDPMLAVSIFWLLATRAKAYRTARLAPVKAVEGSDEMGDATEPDSDVVPSCTLGLQERKRLDMEMRRAGPKHFNWERDAAGSFKMVKVKKAAHLVRLEKAKKQAEAAALAMKPPAIKVKKQQRLVGVVSKKFTDQLGQESASARQKMVENAPVENSGVTTVSESDAENLGHSDSSEQFSDDDGFGMLGTYKWVKTKVGSGVSWSIRSPPSLEALAAMDADRASAAQQAVSDQLKAGSVDSATAGGASSSASTLTRSVSFVEGTAPQYENNSVVRDKLQQLRRRAEARGRVEILPNGKLRSASATAVGGSASQSEMEQDGTLQGQSFTEGKMLVSSNGRWKLNQVVEEK